MDTTSPHFAYVLASYVLSGAVLLGLLLWTVARKRNLDAEARRVLKSGE